MMVGMAVEAVTTGDLEIADRVIDMDDDIDRIYEAHTTGPPDGAQPADGQRPSTDDRPAPPQQHLRTDRGPVRQHRQDRPAQRGLPRVERICEMIQEMGDLVSR
jgi:hypothetical protein